jgi:hypothetical protein
VIPQLRGMLHRRVSCGPKLFRQFAPSLAEPSVVLIVDTSQGHQMRERELGASSMAGQSEGPSASNFHSSRRTASRRSEYDHDGPSGGSGVSTSGQSRCATSLLSLAWRMAERSINPKYCLSFTDWTLVHSRSQSVTGAVSVRMVRFVFDIR